MNRLIQTSVICAALVAPVAATAGEAREDPRAQVTTGFGPLAHPTRPPPALLPAPAQPGQDLTWMVSSAGSSFGFLAGSIAGAAISSSSMHCHTGFLGFPGFDCPTGAMQTTLLVSLSAGAGGAVLGGWAAGVLYRASLPRVQVVPVAGKGAQGLIISGTF